MLKKEYKTKDIYVLGIEYCDSYLNITDSNGSTVKDAIIVYDNKIKKTSEEVDFSTPVQSALPTI